MSPEIPAEALPWKPDSWRRWPALQQPDYPDPAALDRVLAELRVLPPLVTSWEIVQLRQQLAEAAAGTRFVLQAGDCAERFAACTPNRITNMLKVLLQMSLVLVVGAQKPVIRIGRFAGQYAKPRSANQETREGVTLPSFRGDNINRPEFRAEARTPDPQLLLRGYERASLTLNFIRSLVKSGFADLHHPEYFDLDWEEHSPLADEYHHMVGTTGDALRFRSEFHSLPGQKRIRRPAPSRILRPRLGGTLAAGGRIPSHGRNHRRCAALQIGISFAPWSKADSPTCTIPNTSTSIGWNTRRWRPDTITWSEPSAKRCASWRTCWACGRAKPTASISSPPTKRCTWDTNRRRRAPCPAGRAISTSPRISLGWGCAQTIQAARTWNSCAASRTPSPSKWGRTSPASRWPAGCGRSIRTARGAG